MNQKNPAHFSDTSDFDSIQKVPREIGGCTVIEFVGKGGMASVYKGYHQTLCIPVAIKILSSKLTTDEESIKRFSREAQSIAKLEHENLVGVINLGEENGLYFLIMKYVDGETLREILEKKGPIPVPHALNYLLQSCRGLQEAHNKNIIHRDIKPDNLMVTKEGRLKITDFGLAREVEPSASLTQQGEILGSPYYMSPEQCKGKKELIDYHTDIYSLGATFYHLLSGIPPFQAETPILIMMKHIKESPVPLTSIVPHVPYSLAQMITKMMDKDKEARFSSCLEIEQELKRQFGMDALEMKPPSQIQNYSARSTTRPTGKLKIENYAKDKEGVTPPSIKKEGVTPPSIKKEGVTPPGSKPILKNYVIEDTVNADFREQSLKNPPNYAIEETIRIDSSVRKEKPRKRASKGPLRLIFLCILLGGAYAYFYQQAQQQAKSLLEELSKKLSVVPHQTISRIDPLLKIYQYTEAFSHYQQIQQTLQTYEQIDRQRKDFLEQKRLFFLEAIFQTVADEIEKQTKQNQRDIKDIDEKLEKIRLQKISVWGTLLKEGRWSQFLEAWDREKELWKPLFVYQLEPQPELIRYVVGEQELSSPLKEGIRYLFYLMHETSLNHQNAKRLFDQAQEYWKYALHKKDTQILQNCLDTYRELYQKIPETDYHRQSQVPLLVIPELRAESEPEMIRRKEWIHEVTLHVENGTSSQIWDEVGTPSFLISYPLPQKLSPTHSLIHIRIQFQGFKTIEEYIEPEGLEILRYSYPLQRDFEVWEFPEISWLLPTSEQLLLISKKNLMTQIQAIDRQAKIQWNFSLSGELVFSPVILNHWFFVGNTKTFEEELTDAECTLFDLREAPPKKIATVKIPGGVKSSGCFLPDQNMICVAGVQAQGSGKKISGCLRFYSLPELTEALPSVPLGSLVTTEISYLPEEGSVYFGTKNYFGAYSLKNKTILWKEKALEKEEIFSFQPFFNTKGVLICKNTSNSGTLLSYGLKKGEGLQSLDLQGVVPFPPQIAQNLFWVTTHKTLLGFNLETLELTTSYRSPSVLGASAVFDGNYFYLVRENGSVAAINSKSETIWEYSLSSKLPSEAKLLEFPILFGKRLLIPFSHAIIVFNL